MATSGYLLRHASSVSMKDCSVSWGPNPPDYFHHLVDAMDCPGLSDAGLSGNAAHPGTAARYIH